MRETFQVVSNYHADCRDSKPPFNDGRPVVRVNDPDYPYWEQCYYAATESCPELLSVYTDEVEQKWRPSIFMPRWASRITLELTGVRVERLQDISPDDAISEGIERENFTGFGDEPGQPRYPEPDVYRGSKSQDWTERPVDAYQHLWDSLNAKTAPWASNPWVWVLEFRKQSDTQERA